MPIKAGAKASKKARGEAAIRQGKDPDEIFQWLFHRWANEKLSSADRQALALQLLPYVKAKPGPIPAPAVAEALKEARLIVIADPAN